MLKILSKHLSCELHEAREYIHSAFIVKEKCADSADLFIELAEEEIDHAKRIIEQGQRIVNNIPVALNMPSEPHIIWNWEREKAEKEIVALKIRISNFINSKE